MDVTSVTFQQEVIAASKTMPVVVDFWAPWCGPCRALGPIIEKVVGEFAGRVKLVKINSDDNPELSATYNVRSIPYVVAFKDGRPAANFVGALPESQVRAFVEKLLPSESEQALQHAEELFTAERFDEAEEALARVIFDFAFATRIEALRQGIEFARAAADGPGEDKLRKKIAADPNDHEARLALAGLYAAQRHYAPAMDQLLEIVRRAKNWRDGEARKQLLAVFSLAAGEPELVAEYRRKLASTLH